MRTRPYTITTDDLMGKSCKVSANGNMIFMCPECYSLYKMNATGEIAVEPASTKSPTNVKLVLSPTAECGCGHSGKMILIDDLIADAVAALNRLQYYTKASCCSHSDQQTHMLYIDFEESESFSDLPLGWSQSDDGKRLVSYDERSVAINHLYSWLYTLKKCGKE